MRMVDRIDPIELMAVTAATFIVYDIIKSTPEMLAQAQVTFTDTVTHLFLGPVFTPIYDAIFGNAQLSEEQKNTLKQIRETPDLVLFVKSFAIAYIMVKHMGEIVSGVGNVTAWVAGFLKLKVV